MHVSTKTSPDDNFYKPISDGGSRQRYDRDSAAQGLFRRVTSKSSACERGATGPSGGSVAAYNSQNSNRSASAMLSRGSGVAAPHSMLWAGNRQMRNAQNKNVQGMKAILWSPFTILLFAFPFGVIASKDFYDWGASWTFWLNFVALIPMAKILGDATEELDANLNNEVLSGLLNATFGNAVEMIMTIKSLEVGLINVVKTSLLGSVLSNMLLVLGMSFFFGGIVGKKDGEGMALVMEKEQSFHVDGAHCSVTMLLLSCMSFALPTVFVKMGNEEQIEPLSHIGAIIVGVSYLAYLIFQLFTHKNYFSGEEEGEGSDKDNDGEMATTDDDDDGPMLSTKLSIFLLFLMAVLTSISSEFLVQSVEGVTTGSGITQSFIGIILFPIVGNACEHMAAVRFALVDRPGLSVGIAVGSSTQIALFVVPFSVLVGWAMGAKDEFGHPMTLDFGGLHTCVMVLSVLIVMSIVSDGRSNWLEGWMLTAAYVFIAVMYWFDQEVPSG